MSESVSVLLVVSDLMSASRVTPVLQARGEGYRWFRKPEQLASAEAGARLLLVDCHLPGVLEAVSAYKCRSGGTVVVGFASHTDGQTIAHARSAGVDRVMARSVFFDRIAKVLDATV